MFSKDASSTLFMDGTIDVADDLEFEADEATAEAEVDAKDDPALGGCGSGLMVVRSVSHAPSPSGLKLRSRSPRPSTRGRRSRLLRPELFTSTGIACNCGS